MAVFYADEMQDLIYEIANADPKDVDMEVSSTLCYQLEKFEECDYTQAEIKTAITGHQMLCNLSDEYEAQLKKFHKMSKDDIWTIAIHMGFMYGLAYGEKFRKKK